MAFRRHVEGTSAVPFSTWGRLPARREGYDICRERSSDLSDGGVAMAHRRPGARRAHADVCHHRLPSTLPRMMTMMARPRALRQAYNDMYLATSHPRGRPVCANKSPLTQAGSYAASIASACDRRGDSGDRKW